MKKFEPFLILFTFILIRDYFSWVFSLFCYYWDKGRHIALTFYIVRWVFWLWLCLPLSIVTELRCPYNHQLPLLLCRYMSWVSLSQPASMWQSMPRSIACGGALPATAPSAQPSQCAGLRKPGLQAGQATPVARLSHMGLSPTGPSGPDGQGFPNQNGATCNPRPPPVRRRLPRGVRGSNKSVSAYLYIWHT